jgi:hypothetical protein
MNALIQFLVITSPLLLAVASLLWGIDSREAPDSPEWERRRRTAEALAHRRR